MTPKTPGHGNTAHQLGNSCGTLPKQATPGSVVPWPSLQHVELRYIGEVLRHCGNNKAQAARMLNVDYKTLLRKLAQMKGESE